MLCQEGLKCIEPQTNSPLAEMGEGMRGAEGWTLLCPLCTQSKIYTRGGWGGILILAATDGLAYVTKAIQRKTLKCDQQLIYPKLNEDCFVYTRALMSF